jgi:hypothetical protein
MEKSAKDGRAASNNRREVTNSQREILNRDRTIAELQETIRRLSGYICELEQKCRLPQNGSLGGTASDSELISVDNGGGIPVALFSPRARLNMFRDQSKRQEMDSRSPMDDIDANVQKTLRMTNQIGSIRRIRYGVYTIGEGPRCISICVKNNKPLVRSGGGAYIPLDAFLSSH